MNWTKSSCGNFHVSGPYTISRVGGSKNNFILVHKDRGCRYRGSLKGCKAKAHEEVTAVARALNTLPKGKWLPLDCLSTVVAALA